MKPKFKIGDVVYGAKSYKINKQIQCPDCLGKKVWEVRLPSGEEFTIPCSTCERGFEGCWGTVTKWVQSPVIEELTIGSVRTNTEDKQHPISYMCKETGVGSGTIHYEEDLHSTRIEALKHATEKSKQMIREEENRKRQILDLGKKRSKRNPLK